VPRGPKAVLETTLEKSAPASALPGCNSMATMSTTDDAMKSMYKIVINLRTTPNLSIVINNPGEALSL